MLASYPATGRNCIKYSALRVLLTPVTAPGYDRGSPFSFKLGGGQVIKGFVDTLHAA